MSKDILGQLINRYDELSSGRKTDPSIEEASIYGNRGVRGIPTFSHIDLNDYKRLVPDPVLTGDVTDEARLREIRARNQSTLEQLGAGLLKFTGKTITNAVGGLAMLPTTIGVAIGQTGDLITGEDRVKWSDIYDNAFQKAMDDASSWMDVNLPNYRTRAESEMSLLKQLRTANFWADDFLGGMSFLTGAVLTEMGAVTALSKIGKAVKLGKVLDKTAKADDVINAYKQAGVRSQIGDMLRINRQVITGAGYEAGVEARHFRDEAMKELGQEFLEKNGREPDKEEYAALLRQANSVANGVFASNLITVSLGNMVALSKTFGPGARKVVSPVDPSRFVKKAGKLTTKPVTGWDKTLRFVKNAFVKPGGEAAEEFTQSLIQSTAMDYTMGKYSPGGADTQYSIIEALGNAFNETMDSKDAWKETFLGYLLGLVGVPGLSSSSAVDAFNSFSGRANRLESQIADKYNKANTLPIFSSAINNNNRQYELEKQYDDALEEGDMFRAKNIENMQINSWLSSRYDAGLLDEDVKEFAEQVEEMKDDQFRESFGYDENFSSEEITKRKKETTGLIKNLASEYKSSRRIAEGVVQNKSDLDLLDGLTFSIFSLKNLDRRIDSVYNKFNTISNRIRGKELDSAVTKMVKAKGVRSPWQLIKALKDSEEYAEQGESLDKAIKDPLRRTEIKAALIDLQRMKLQREKQIEEYNMISSPRGQKEFTEQANNLRNAAMKRMIIDIAFGENIVKRRAALEKELANIQAEKPTTPQGLSGKERRLKNTQDKLTKVAEAEGYKYFTDEPYSLALQSKAAGVESTTQYQFQSELFRGLGNVALQFDDVASEVEEMENEEGIETPPPTKPPKPPENLFKDDPDAIAKNYHDLVMVYNNYPGVDKQMSNEILSRINAGEDIPLSIQVRDYNPPDPYYNIGKNVFIERGSMWPDGSRKSIIVFAEVNGKQVEIGAMLAPDRFGFKSGNQFVSFDPNDPKYLAKINPRFTPNNVEGRMYTETFNALRDFWNGVKASGKDSFTQSELSQLKFRVLPFRLLRPDERPPLSTVYTAAEHGFAEIDGKKALVVSYPKGGYWYKHDGGQWQTVNEKDPVINELKDREATVMQRRTKLGRSKKKGGEELGRQKQNAAVLLIDLNGVDEFVALDTPLLGEQSVAAIEETIKSTDEILRQYIDRKDLTHEEVWREVIKRLGVEKNQVGDYKENKPVVLTPKNFSLPITMRDADGEQMRFDTQIIVFINKGENGFGYEIQFKPLDTIKVSIRKNKKGVWYASSWNNQTKQSYSSTIGENFTIPELIRVVAKDAPTVGKSLNDRFTELGINMNYTESALADPTVIGFDQAPVQAIPDLRLEVSPRYTGKRKGNASKRKEMTKQFREPTGRTEEGREFVPLKEKGKPVANISFTGEETQVEQAGEVSDLVQARKALAGAKRSQTNPAFVIFPDGSFLPVEGTFDDQGNITTSEGVVNIDDIQGIADSDGVGVWMKGKQESVEKTSKQADSEVSGDVSPTKGLDSLRQKFGEGKTEEEEEPGSPQETIYSPVPKGGIFFGRRTTSSSEPGSSVYEINVLSDTEATYTLTSDSQNRSVALNDPSSFISPAVDIQVPVDVLKSGNIKVVEGKLLKEGNNWKITQKAKIVPSTSPPGSSIRFRPIKKKGQSTEEDIDFTGSKKISPQGVSGRKTDKPVKIDTRKVVKDNISERENESLKEELGVETNDQVEEIVEQEVNKSLNNEKSSYPAKSILARVVARIKKILLNLLLVASFIGATSFTSPTSIGDATINEVRVENLDNWNKVILDQERINKLDNFSIINEANRDTNEEYLVVDKFSGLAHLCYNGELTTTYEVGVGRKEGDAQTKTVVRDGKVYWQEGNQTTGAGIFTINGKGKFKGEASFVLLNERGIEIPTVLHKTLPSRRKYFGNNNAEDNRMSYGCINFRGKDIRNLGSRKGFGKGSKVYVLPENPHNKFIVKDGNLRFVSNDKNVNRTIAPYVARDIVIEAEGANKTGKKLLGALSGSKAAIMDLYPTVSNDIYNKAVRMTYGVFGQETSFGTYGKGRGQLGRITDIAGTVLGKNVSAGVTQIRITTVNDKVKEKFGINETKDLFDVENAAIATITHLLDIYVNQIPSTRKKEFEELAVLAYNNPGEFRRVLKENESVGNNYVKKVQDNYKPVTIYLTDQLGGSIDDIAPAFSIEENVDFETYDLEQAIDNLRQILPIKDENNPNGFEVKDIAQILGSLRNNGVTMGAFMNDAIYLLTGGREYHEAFHAVFRTLINSAERARLYKQAEKQFGKPTKQDINTLRNKSESYKDLSDEVMYNLVLEERLAEDFNDYALKKKKKSFFARLWNKILRFIKSMLNKQDELELFYDQILQGRFRGAVPVSDRTYTHEPVFAVLKSLGVVEETEEGVLVGDTRLSIKDSNMLVIRIAKSLMSKGIFDPSVEDVRLEMAGEAEFFLPSNWEDEIRYVHENRGIAEAQRFVDRLISIYNALNTSTDDVVYDKILAASGHESGGYRFVERTERDNDEQILKEVKVKLSFYARPDTFDEVDSDEELQDDKDKTTELFHRGANKYGGFNSESKALRTYLSFISAEHDYFDLGLSDDLIEGQPEKYVFPIDGQTVYNGLLSTLKNVEKVDGNGRSGLLKVLKALSSHGYNSNVEQFTTRLIEDIYGELTEQGFDITSPLDVFDLPHEALVNSNYYNMFVGGFYKIEQDYMQVNVVRPEKDGMASEIKTFNAAQSDSSRLQYDRWLFNFRRLDIGKGELLKLSNRDLPGLLNPSLKKAKNPYELEQLITDNTRLVHAILKSGFGIEVSPLLIRYSIIKNLDLDDTNPEFSPFTDFLKAFPHIDDLEYLNTEFMDGLYKAVKQSKDGNVYQITNVLQENVQGAIGRLKRLAYTNTYFDEKVRVTTIQNSEGETIYTITSPSFDTILALKIRSFARSNPEQLEIFRDALIAENFEEAYPVFEAMFGSLLRTPYRTRKYFDALKFNPLLTDKNFDLKEFFPKVILGSRPVSDENAPSSNFADMGTSFWKLDKASKILMMMGLYANSSATYNSKGQKLIIPAILEDKSTTKLYAVPDYRFVDQKGQLTDLAVKHLSSHFRTEYERIKTVQQEIRQILTADEIIPNGFRNTTGKITEILADYHHRNNIFKHPDTGKVYRMERMFDEDGDLSGLEFTEADPNEYYQPLGLQFFHFHEMTNSYSYQSAAIKGDEFNTVKSKIIDDLTDFVQVQFDSFLDMISSDNSPLIRNVSTAEGPAWQNRYLPSTNEVPYSEKGKVRTDRVKQFFVMDYINSLSINAFNQGDVSVGLHKTGFAANARDVVKRNGGLLSAGNELGGNSTTVAGIMDEETILDNPLLARNNSGDVAAETQDGQSYASGTWYAGKYLQSTSKANPEIRRIALKLQVGIPLTGEEAKKLEDGAAIVNDKKISVRSMYDYIKTSAHMQTREKVSYIDPAWKIQYVTSGDPNAWEDELFIRWAELSKLKGQARKNYFDANISPIYKPIRGFEYHHNMLNTMDSRGIAIIFTSTAAKLAQQDIGDVKDNEFRIVPYEIADNFIREQVKNDKFSSEITHGTQLQQLIWSEQDNVDEDGNPVKVSVDGVPTTPVSASESYIGLLAYRVLRGMNIKRKEIFDEDGDVDYNKLWSKIRGMLESSNPDPQLIELFRVESGMPVYNWNLPSVYKKLQAMYLSYVSKGTLKHKVPGFKYTLVSAKGHNVLVDSNDNVVPKYEYLQAPGKYEGSKYSTRNLKFERVREEDGVPVYESEVIVSQRILQEYGLSVGDTIPAELLLQSGTRIPTQDKHSMIVMRVVDFLPNHYGTSVIMPDEAVWLAGEDFDIDAKYAFRYSTYKVGNKMYKYGEYLKRENGLKVAYREYQQAEGEIGYEEFLAEYESTIRANQEHYRNGEFGKVKPLTLAENNNLLLSLELALIHNKANRNIRSTATSLNPFREADEYFRSLGITLEDKVYGVASAYDKATAVHEINVGDEGIGPVALFNVLFQRLNKYRIRLQEQVNEEGEVVDIKVFGQYDNFENFEVNGQRINDLISSTLTAMTDNAKELIAVRYNLNANNLGPFLTMVAMGVPFNMALTFMKQPVITKLTSMVEGSRRMIRTAEENKKFRKSGVEGMREFVEEIFTNYRDLPVKVSSQITQDSLAQAMLWAKNNDFQFSPRPAVQNERVGEPINVYFGTSENKHLSNFAYRPFTYEGVRFESVENAFQYAKLKYATGDNAVMGDKILTSSAPLAKKLGRQIKGLDRKAWDTAAYGIMVDLIRQSFLENPQALQKLKVTGTAPITHTQDKGRWGKDFPSALMSVRSEFLGEMAEEVVSEEEQDFISLQKEVANEFLRLNDMSTELQAFTQIMKLIKGTKSTWEDEADIYDRLETMKVRLKVEKASYFGDDLEIKKDNENNYVGYYRLGNDSYKISFEQIEGSNFGLAEIINKDKLIFTQLASRIVLESDSAKLFIQNTTDFRDFVDSMKSMIRPSSLRYANSRAKINQEILTFLNLRAYTHLTGYSPDLVSLFDFVVPGNEVMSPIEYLTNSLQDHQHYSTNPLLRFFRFRDVKYSDRVYTRGAEGGATLNIVEGNTRTNTDPDYKNLLIDGYTDLLFSPVSDKFGGSSTRLKAAYEAARDQYRQTGDDAYLLNFMSSLDGVDKAKLLSMLLYDYLIVRDGMQYRNNGIVKNLDPRIFKTFAKSLDAVQRLFAGDKTAVFKGEEIQLDYESVFGKSKDELIREMSELYGRSFANKGDLRYVSQGRLYKLAGSQEGKKALFIDRFSGELKVSLYAGTGEIKSKEGRAKRIQQNKNTLSSTGVFTRFDKDMILPLTFSTSVRQGDKMRSKIYKLKSLTRGKKEITDPREFVKDGKIEGSYAVYELVDYFADRQTNIYSFTPEYMEVFPSLLGLPEKKLEGKDKIDHLVGVIASLPSDKGFPDIVLNDGTKLQMAGIKGNRFRDRQDNYYSLERISTLSLGGELKYGEQDKTDDKWKTIVDKSVRPVQKQSGKWVSIKEIREQIKKDNNLDKCD